MKNKQKANGAVKPEKLNKKIERPAKTTLSRPARAELTAEEVAQRMRDFGKRRDEFIAAIRKSKN